MPCAGGNLAVAAAAAAATRSFSRLRDRPLGIANKIVYVSATRDSCLDTADDSWTCPKYAEIVRQRNTLGKVFYSGLEWILTPYKQINESEFVPMTVNNIKFYLYE